MPIKADTIMGFRARTKVIVMEILDEIGLIKPAKKSTPKPPPDPIKIAVKSTPKKAAVKKAVGILLVFGLASLMFSGSSFALLRPRNMDQVTTDTWTFQNVNIATGIALSSITTTGDLDLESTSSTAASGGPLVKWTLQSGVTYTGTSAGLSVKAYDASTGVVHNGGELCGLYVNLKQQAAMTGGGESSILSLHNYPGAVDPNFGARIFGDFLGSSLQFAAGTPALYVIDMDIATPTTGDIRVSGAQVITSGDWTLNSEVYEDVAATLPIGSMAIGAGKVYIKLTNDGDEADWEYIDTTDD